MNVYRHSCTVLRSFCILPKANTLYGLQLGNVILQWLCFRLNIQSTSKSVEFEYPEYDCSTFYEVQYSAINCTKHSFDESTSTLSKRMTAALQDKHGEYPCDMIIRPVCNSAFIALSVPFTNITYRQGSLGTDKLRALQHF